MAAAGRVAVTADCRSVPPLFLVEAMAQLAGIAAGQEGGRGVLAGLEQVELPRAVPEGVPVELTARIVRSFGALFLVEGEARAPEGVIARAKLILAVGKG